MKCLVVGLGNIGLGYAATSLDSQAIVTHAQAIAACEGLDLVAGVDIDEAKRREFEQVFKKESFADIDVALDMCLPDIVVVASPTETHLPMVKKIVAHGRPRAILCEKPFSGQVVHARAMSELSDDANIPIFVNYQRRADPVLKDLAAEIRLGALGPKFKGCLWYTKGIIHNGSHFVDLLFSWLGMPQAVRILGTAAREIELAWSDVVQLSFDEGEIYLLGLDYLGYEEASLEIFGIHSYIKLDDSRGCVLRGFSCQNKLWSAERVLRKDENTSYLSTQRLQLLLYQELRDALRGQPHGLCSAADTAAMLTSMEPVIVGGLA